MVDREGPKVVADAVVNLLRCCGGAFVLHDFQIERALYMGSPLPLATRAAKELSLTSFRYDPLLLALGALRESLRVGVEWDRPSLGLFPPERVGVESPRGLVVAARLWEPAEQGLDHPDLWGDVVHTEVLPFAGKNDPRRVPVVLLARPASTLSDVRFVAGTSWCEPKVGPNPVAVVTRLLAKARSG